MHLPADPVFPLLCKFENFLTDPWEHEWLRCFRTRPRGGILGLCHQGVMNPASRQVGVNRVGGASVEPRRREASGTRQGQQLATMLLAGERPVLQGEGGG